MPTCFRRRSPRGTELADYTEQNISAARDFVLSQAKDFQDIIRIQTEFMQIQFSVFAEQTKSLVLHPILVDAQSHRQIAETKCVHESPPAQGHSQPSRRLPRNAAAVIATAKAKNSQPTVSICGLRSCAKDIGNVGEGNQFGRRGTMPMDVNV